MAFVLPNPPDITSTPPGLARLCPPRCRWGIVGCLIVVILLGLGSRQFSEWLPKLLAQNVGDALWTMALFFALAWVWPNSAGWRLAGMALLLSFAVECSQLVSLPGLDAIRANRLGRLLLGTDFTWLDFPRYIIGAVAAGLLDRLLPWWRCQDQPHSRQAAGTAPVHPTDPTQLVADCPSAADNVEI